LDCADATPVAEKHKTNCGTDLTDREGFKEERG